MSSSPSTRPTGARCAVIRSRSTTSFCRSFTSTTRELLGISVDGVWCHAAFARGRNLHFPLLADFEPKGEVARKYRAYRATEGVCERALFVLDREGTIAWSYCSPIAVNPGADGILAALERLSKQGNAHG